MRNGLYMYRSIVWEGNPRDNQWTLCRIRDGKVWFMAWDIGEDLLDFSENHEFRRVTSLVFDVS